jgi:hypothetical protein
MSNPGNMTKYQNNPKVMNILTKLTSKLGGGAAGGACPFPGGMGGGFPGMGGGFPGMGGFGGGDGPAPPSGPKPPSATDDLD